MDISFQSLLNNELRYHNVVKVVGAGTFKDLATIKVGVGQSNKQTISMDVHLNKGNGTVSITKNLSHYLMNVNVHHKMINKMVSVLKSRSKAIDIVYQHNALFNRGNLILGKRISIGDIGELDYYIDHMVYDIIYIKGWMASYAHEVSAMSDLRLENAPFLLSNSNGFPNGMTNGMIAHALNERLWRRFALLKVSDIIDILRHHDVISADSTVFAWHLTPEYMNKGYMIGLRRWSKKGADMVFNKIGLTWSETLNYLECEQYEQDKES